MLQLSRFELGNIHFSNSGDKTTPKVIMLSGLFCEIGFGLCLLAALLSSQRLLNLDLEVGKYVHVVDERLV